MSAEQDAAATGEAPGMSRIETLQRLYHCKQVLSDAEAVLQNCLGMLPPKRMFPPEDFLSVTVLNGHGHDDDNHGA